MAEDIKSYKCPACAAPLVYDPSGQLLCNACGNKYDIETIEKLYSAVPGEENFDWEGYKENFEADKENLQNTKVYVCKSCGAEIEATATTAATHCPYCDNEVILTDKLGSGIRPNLIIPFAKTKDEAMAAIKNHFKGKKLLPNNFAAAHKLEKMQGIYVPFWLFDASIDGPINFDASRVMTWSDSDYIYTQTSHYLVEAEGSMGFTKVPVDGSVKMDDDLMDAIEPFDYSGLRNFDEAFLSGYLADRFDDDPDVSLPRAQSRMHAITEQTFKQAADTSYATFSIRNNLTQLINPTVKYVLLPVYLLNLKYENKNYRFAVNGQTGKVVGELPISKKKQFMYGALTFLIVAAVIIGITFLISRL